MKPRRPLLALAILGLAAISRAARAGDPRRRRRDQTGHDAGERKGDPRGHEQGVAGWLRPAQGPILLARAVMARGDGGLAYVMLAGAGAEAFAKEQGISLVDPAYFRTEERWQQLQKALKRDAAGKPHADGGTAGHFGTVGAVALDAQGHLAAGTSTGGMNDKRWDRIGDSPIIGAGTCANSGCAVPSIGWGEYYIRTVAAVAICMRVTQMRVPDQAGRRRGDQPGDPLDGRQRRRRACPGPGRLNPPAPAFRAPGACSACVAGCGGACRGGGRFRRCCRRIR